MPLISKEERAFVVATFFERNTAWKVSKYGVISGPYFPAFGLNRNRENSWRRGTARSKKKIELVRNLLENNPNLTRIYTEKYGRHVEWKFAEIFPRNSFSASMQQIYKRKPMWKFDLNKVGLQLYRTHTSAWVFSCIFAVCMQNRLFEEHLLESVPEFLML